MFCNKRFHDRTGALVYAVCLLLLSHLLLYAQSTPDSTPITAANISRLQSTTHLDFASLDADFVTGWFALNHTGTQFAVVTQQQAIWILDDSGELLAQPLSVTGADDLPAGVVDVAFGRDGVAAIFFDGAMTTILYQTLLDDDDDAQRVQVTPSLDGMPVRAWQHCTDDLPCSLWLEVLPASPDDLPAVLELDLETGDIRQTQPYVPADDPEAVVRIGRIPAPYEVTSSETGEIKLWQLEQATVLQQTQLPQDFPATFGNINLPPTHLVWRDNASETLYRLNLQTGDNQTITDLDGRYAQWFFLTSDSESVLAVNLDFEPVVVAWDVATGTETVLASHRDCNRVPDMARLSPDGTTLVIGCDTGLDIWRITPDQMSDTD